MRLMGARFRSLPTRFGFSPSAIFTPAGSLMTMSSATEPAVLMTATWPPMMLPDP